MSAIRAISRCFCLAVPSKIKHLQAVTGKHLHPFAIHLAQIWHKKSLQTCANPTRKYIFHKATGAFRSLCSKQLHHRTINAAGALVLMSSGLYPSAFTLMRPQYESLVRAIWLLYAASDAWGEKAW